MAGYGACGRRACGRGARGRWGEAEGKEVEEVKAVEEVKEVKEGRQRNGAGFGDGRRLVAERLAANVAATDQREMPLGP